MQKKGGGGSWEGLRIPGALMRTRVCPCSCVHRSVLRMEAAHHALVVPSRDLQAGKRCSFE